MAIDFETQFSEAVGSTDPQARIERLNVRLAGTIQEFLVFSSTLLATITALWKLLEVWRAQHRRIDIHIEYLSTDDRHITLNLADRTQKELDQFLAQNPPKQEGSLKAAICAPKPGESGDAH